MKINILQGDIAQFYNKATKRIAEVLPEYYGKWEVEFFAERRDEYVKTAVKTYTTASAALAAAKEWTK